ncbi:hypothetical protein LY76DRAFT_154796 [Colletotrichum caudatum]|nr:hypothetical protein LY76DRAFT_154796 [Colletotrichum caudatum]
MMSFGGLQIHESFSSPLPPPPCLSTTRLHRTLHVDDAVWWEDQPVVDCLSDEAARSALHVHHHHYHTTTTTPSPASSTGPSMLGRPCNFVHVARSMGSKTGKCQQC